MPKRVGDFFEPKKLPKKVFSFLPPPFPGIQGIHFFVTCFSLDLSGESREHDQFVEFLEDFFRRH